MSGNSANHSHSHQYLAELSLQAWYNRKPVIIYLCGLLVVGVVGNALSFLVYFLRFHESSTRVFVLARSVHDLLINVLGVPLQLVTIRHAYDMHSLTTCRLRYVFTTLPTAASGFCLVLVAYDRYRRICRPCEKQMTPGQALWMVVGATAAAIVLFVPFTWYYGDHYVDTPRAGVQAVMCWSHDGFRGTAYHTVHFTIMSASFVVSFVAMMGFYFLIARTVFRRRFSGLWNVKVKPSARSPSRHASFVTGVSEQSSVDRTKTHGAVATITSEIACAASSSSSSVLELASKSSSSKKKLQSFGEDGKPYRSAACSKGPSADDVALNVVKAEAPGHVTEQDEVAVRMEATPDGGSQHAFSAANVSKQSDDVKETAGTEDQTPCLGKSSEPEDLGDILNRRKSCNTDGRWRLSLISDGLSTQGTVETATRRQEGRCRQTGRCGCCRERRKSGRVRWNFDRRLSVDLQGRTTRMMGVLTFLYLINWLPFIVLRIKCQQPVNFCENFTDCGWNMYGLALRSYFLNSGLNAIVYSFCNPKFRQECHLLFTAKNPLRFWW